MKVEAPPKEINFVEIEKKVAEFWQSDNIFKKSVESRPESNPYRFYDGPPFATGLPHFGHFVPSSIKDAFLRYFTMKGYRAERRFGWDCHGVPVELLIQSELGLKGKLDIEAYGIDRFNAACRESVLRYTAQWKTYMERLGRWVDMDNCYRTMDLSFMESVWAVFRKLWEKGLIYEGKQVMSYSSALSSSLSNFEASLDYRDVQDPSVTVTAPLTGSFAGASLLVWTTTPWTLPANIAIVVDPKASYVLVKDHTHDDRNVILLKSRLDAYFPDVSLRTIEKEFMGQELVGLSYEPFFEEFSERRNERTHRIYGVDYVLHDTGTGAVHTAPAFGEDDFRCAQLFDLPLVDHLDEGGRYLPGNRADLVGLGFKEGEKNILKELKSKGRVYRHDTLVHSYPMCYRSGQPLIYRATPSWFVAVEKFKERLIENNKKIAWVPEHIKDKRFGKWLENARDWNIGRTRYWGNPIPIWKNDDTGECVCIGSVSELERYAGRSLSDLHMEHIDDITIPSPTGKGVLKRVPFVFDCWFESGSMPYGQSHYPFSGEDDFRKVFPADFISEGLDQTRGWFYTLHVLSTALFDQPAFKNVVVNGIVLAEDGRKMSKSLRNFPDPMATLDEFGADSVRLCLLGSPATAGEEIRFSTEAVRDTTRRLLLPIWNAYTFFATYASIDAFDPEKEMTPASHELDEWIMLKFHELLKKMDEAMNRYHIAKTIPYLTEFIDDLNNWYIRRNRRRFWNSDRGAYSTLFQVLVGLSQLMAPFAPFLSEELFSRLKLTKGLSRFESVHLTTLPEGGLPETTSQKDLLARVGLARQIVEMGRSLRTVHKLKNRQPLSCLFIALKDFDQRRLIEQVSAVICDELNVKEVTIVDNVSELAHFRVKPDFKKLGKTLGESLRPIQKALAELEPNVIDDLRAGASIRLHGHEITTEQVVIELLPHPDKVVAGTPELVVALDTRLTPALRLEGVARELVSVIQKSRKSANFAVEDRILLALDTQAELHHAIENNKVYIEEETLAKLVSLSELESRDDVYSAQLLLEGENIRILMKRAASQSAAFV